MAEILRYCDPNAAAGGNGTTNSLSGDNRAYSSLNAWEAATQQDLTDGGGDTARVVCSSDDAGSTHAADTAVIIITGWTTSATCYITIEAASSHGGKWNDGIYRLALTSANFALTIQENYVRAIGIQASRESSSSTFTTVIGFQTIDAGGSYCLLDKMIVKGILSGTAASFRGIQVNDADVSVDVRNSIIYDFSVSGGVGINCVTGTTINLLNNTVHNCATGYSRTAGTVTATNCGAAACTTGFAGTITQTTCSTTTPTFVNEAGDDFHLTSGDTTWKDQGTDLSGTFTDDIDGDTRTGTWDIGADEYVAAGGGSAEITPTIGSLSASGVASRNDRGITVPTEIDV